jgi:dihydropyrimidinase
MSQAKASGVSVFGETCPHYLLFDDSVYNIRKLDQEVLPFILSPPIRTSDDQDGLWEAIRKGWIDVVATDHCPFHLHGQKDRGIHDFTHIPNGTGSIEHRVNLLFTFGVTTGRISLLKFVELVATNPARIFGFGHCKGAIVQRFDADMVIWDPEMERVISAGHHFSRADHNIYEGVVIKGSPHIVFIKGIPHLTERKI